MLLKRPVLSEKTAQGMSSGLYVFEVSRMATKPALKTEVKKLFDVEATSVRIVNLPAKKVTFRRHKGQRSARRHAYIQLKEGQKFPGFELPKEAVAKTKKGDK